MDRAYTSPRWTSAFLFSAAVWALGMACGYAVVRVASGLPSEVPAPESTPELPANVETPACGQVVAGSGCPIVAIVDGGTGSPPERHLGQAPASAPMSGATLWAFIFRRNLTVFVWLLAGLLSAGTVTLAVLLANGINLGHTMAAASGAGMPAGVIGSLLIPHGLLEIGTFCIAGAVGFQGFRLRHAWTRTGWPAIRDLRLGIVLAYGAFALAAAALVETYVTAALAESVSMGVRAGVEQAP